MKSRIAAGLIAGLLVAAPAFAQRTPEPIVNFPNQMIATASGKPVQADQFRKAVADAAARARNWTTAQEPNGTLLATRTWNDHVIVVAITYATDRYSMAY